MSPADVTHIRGALAATLRAGSMIAVVTTLGILVAACGSSNSPATASVTPSPTPTPTEKAISKVDACTLVTAAEATAVAGTPVASL
ncbi:MAG: hypothetical protein M3082_08830, partial [Candidatus Dormibacteraeota bacterium]|nr:hypothetical protein [Candidatus Dormibacteraeota bacterium]